MSANAEGRTQKAEHWNAGLPDSDITVLVRLADDEWPLVLGFHDGEVWRDSNADTIDAPIVGWLHLNEAADLLDQALKGAS